MSDALDNKGLEAACKAAWPQLFSDDQRVAHQAASPLSVGYARRKHADLMENGLIAYLHAAPVTEQDVEAGARAWLRAKAGVMGHHWPDDYAERRWREEAPYVRACLEAARVPATATPEK